MSPMTGECLSESWPFFGRRVASSLKKLDIDFFRFLGEEKLPDGSVPRTNA
tara:strand:+ start:458 stop:610 length:153 start_codon:yes stop_codon:yes gene_type:complete